MFELDHRILEWFADHRSGKVTQLAQWIGNPEESLGFRLAMVAILGLGLLALRQWRPLLVAPVAYLMAKVTAGALKDVFAEPRPPRKLVVLFTHGYTMPSDHACFTAAVATAIVLTVQWPSARWRAAGVLGALWFSLVTGGLMVYGGAHYASDVVVGWILGLAIGMLLAIAVRELFGWPGPAAGAGPPGSGPRPLEEREELVVEGAEHG